MQLIFQGGQDVYLTGNPNMTYFKTVYRRYTQFGTEYITLQYDPLPSFTPTQQTKAERQTGVYQLEQIFDIIDGNTAPNAHIVVLIDKEFSGLIFCYDGQHQTFSYADAILNNKSFKLEHIVFDALVLSS